MPPPLSLSNFQFRTIGQEPELLKRLSGRNPSPQEYQYSSRSPSPSSDSAIQSQAEGRSRSHNQPSLRLRLSLFQALASEEVIKMQHPPNTGSSNVPNALSNPSHAHSMNTPLTSDLASRSTPSPSSLAAPSNSFSFGPHSAATSLSAQPLINSNSAHGQRSSSVSWNSDPSSLMSQHAIQPSVDQGSLHSKALSTVNETSGRFSNSVGSPQSDPQQDEPSLATLRSLQVGLSETLATLAPVNSSNALDAAQSVKEQCTTALSAAKRAHTLAQQALASARESMSVAQECLTAVHSIQNRVDEAVDAVQKISSGQGHEWNNTIRILKDGLSSLDKWAKHREVVDTRRQHELQQEVKCRQQADTQAAGVKIASTSKSAAGQPLSPSSATSDPSVMAVDQASDTEPEMEKMLKQNTERQKRAEEELRKRREAEERLEQESKRIRAQAESQEAELARVRKERIKAEEEELARQQKEDQELERQQELERARHETIQFRLLQQRQQEKVARKETEEKEKTRQAEIKLEARLLTEQDQKRREMQERAELAKRLQVEKRKAEEQRQQQLREEQEARRREIQARKQRANQEAAHDPKNSPSPPSQMQLLQSMPSPNNIPPPLSAEIGNVVSKKTVTNIATSNKLALKHVTSFPSSVPTGHGQPPSLASPLPLASAVRPIAVKATPSSTPSVAGLDLGPTQANQALPSIVPPPAVCQVPKPSLPPIDLLKEKNNRFSTPPPPSDCSDIAVDSVGFDIGNVPVIPRSQLLPLSPETRKANLRPFMHAHGIADAPSIKSDPDEVKPAIKLERSSPPLSQMNVNTHTKVPPKPEITIGPPKAKARQPPIDIPRLSLPSPPASVKSQATPASTKFKSNAPKAPNDVNVAAPNLKLVNPNGSESTVKVPHSCVNTLSWVPPKVLIHIKAEHEGANVGSPPTQTSRMQVPPSLSKRPTPQCIPVGLHSLPTNAKLGPTSLTPTGVNPHEASQMGPDAAMTGGWSQQNATQDESLDTRQRSRSRQTSIDHYSPSPSPVNIRNGGDLRPRVPLRGDHYSPPRRGPESLPASSSRDDYQRRSPPLRRGQGSVSNSRGVSPYAARSSISRDNRRSLSQDVGPGPSTLAGRKRFRDEEHSNAPPPRRYRYGEYENYNDSGTSGGPSNNDLNWSRSAVYGRSLSPENRATPLALRMGPEPVNAGWERHNSYRASNGNNYRLHARNQRGSPPAHSEGDSYRPNNYSSNYRNQAHEPPPGLLSRFTDLDKGSQNNRPPRPRVPRPTGRGGSNYSPNNRTSNRGQALIDRMKVGEI
ncbi:unnamed protein product [Cyclocybe aegerita]|uniref:Uncharacterized protein n=1 Tax=Cyclocybe aegerita TaxID=1973307 RepID=A0A8S0W498_CYCAE|nr:unnamed protein product [Cyclocybe aegerita]